MLFIFKIRAKAVLWSISRKNESILLASVPILFIDAKIQKSNKHINLHLAFIYSNAYRNRKNTRGFEIVYINGIRVEWIYIYIYKIYMYNGKNCLKWDFCYLFAICGGCKAMIVVKKCGMM